MCGNASGNSVILNGCFQRLSGCNIQAYNNIINSHGIPLILDLTDTSDKPKLRIILKLLVDRIGGTPF
jgi:hypothetical protein